MSVEETFREGDIDRALSELKQQIRQDPSNAKLRIFLFQLFCLQGNWQSAVTQLDVIKDMEAGAIPMVQAYRELIRCEVFREGVFDGKRQPLIFGQPEQWLALLLEAMKYEHEGHIEHAESLRAEALEMAPASAGQIDNQAFNWLADADSRLGPVLETMINGKYYWIPFSNIKEITIEKPEDLRDLVWMPAHFIWTNEGDAVGFIPTRYHGSQVSDDSKIIKAAKTEWRGIGPNTFHGLGQRLLTSDRQDYPLLEIRHITLNESGS